MDKKELNEKIYYAGNRAFNLEVEARRIQDKLEWALNERRVRDSDMELVNKLETLRMKQLSAFREGVVLSILKFHTYLEE